MGQRLVLNFTLNNETVVTLYQHWSGYTQNALETLLEISNAGNKLDLFMETDTEIKKKKLIKTMMTFGYVAVENEASRAIWTQYLTDDEISENLAKPYTTNIRNIGLIDIDPVRMDENLDYAEMLVYIDIETFSLRITQLFDELDLDEFDEDEHEYLVSGNEITVEKLREQATQLGYDANVELSDSIVIDDLYYITSDNTTTVYQLNNMTNSVLVDFA